MPIFSSIMTSAELKKEIPFLVSIFFIALGLRIAYLVFLQKNYIFYNHPSSDVTYYQNWAVDIIRGKSSLGQVYWGLPLYPYFLAALKTFSLGNDLAVRIIHLAIGSFNCIFLYILARNIFTQNIARLSAILMATNFVLIHYDWLMMPVTPLITLSLIILISFIKYKDSTSIRTWFLLGFLIGITCLGDSKLVIFLFLLGLYLFTLHQKQYSKVSGNSVIAFLLGVTIILGGVTLRNKIIGGDWIFVTAQGGLSLFIGNNSQATGIFENPDFIRPTHEGQDTDQRIIAEKMMGRALTPSEVSGYWRDKAISFIVHSPVQYFGLLKNKFTNFFTDNETAYDIDLLLQREWKNKLDINSLRIMVPLAIMGMLITARSYPRTHISILLVASQLIFTLLFFLTHRHRATILPVLFIFESYAIFWLLDKFKGGGFKILLVAILSMSTFFVLLKPMALKREAIDFLYFSKSGAILEKKGETEQAKSAYRSALKIYPLDTNVLCNLANTLAAEGNYTEAIDYYKKALSIVPFHTDALYNLAFVYEKIGKHELALSFYKDVVELDPRSYDAHFQIGFIYKNLGDCTNALKYFNKTISLNPSLQNHVESIADGCISR